LTSARFIILLVKGATWLAPAGRERRTGAFFKDIAMREAERWRHMSTAPRDGSRILVTVRPVEQGPADVDVAYWAQADRYAMEGWRAADSTPGAIIFYAEPELKCWMPLPGANVEVQMPAPWEGEEEELDGSGI
jgi:hypothetical protein